jgi:hypothetical protein
MFNKTMAIFLTTLALFVNLSFFKGDNATTTTEPVPTQDATSEPPPPPPSGDRGGTFEPEGVGTGDY